MFQALGTCASVPEFEHLLDSTNVTGRRTRSNFGVIDSAGAAGMYETGATQYWKYDATDTNQAPDGYVLRTNFSMIGGGSDGIERFNRTVDLIGGFYAGDSLSHKSILRSQMRDFSDHNSIPIHVPYLSQWTPEVPRGYINTAYSICRSTSMSAVVIQGILSGEAPELTTMWTILGQPAASIAVPYWPVGEVPSGAGGDPTAPLCDIANQIRWMLFYDNPLYSAFINTLMLRDEHRKGIWEKTFSTEDSIFAITDAMRSQWRSDTISVSEMLKTEDACANYALNTLQESYSYLVSARSPEIAIHSPKNSVLYQNYPNPFNSSTVISWQLAVGSDVELSVYNSLGEKVATLVLERMSPGNHTYIFEGRNLASGIYYYQLVAGDPSTCSGSRFREVKKMILLK